MPLFTHSTNNTYHAYKLMVDYCTTPLNISMFKNLQHSISNLTLNELLLINTMGETLLFSAIALSKDFSPEQCSNVMFLLLDRAQQIDPSGYAREVLLFTKNAQDVSPLQRVLEIESLQVINTYSTTVGYVFFSHLKNHLSYCNPLRHSLDILSISAQTLHSAFMHSNILYLQCIHMALAAPNIAVMYKAIFFESNQGSRLFDKLILGSSVTILAGFFEELRFLKQCGLISHQEHVDLLTHHPKFEQGFSPFHELVLDNDLKKIALYVRELNTIVTPKVFASYLLKKNQKQYTVLQQGINNGPLDSVASIDIARFFISLLDPIYFPIEKCISLITGDFENKPLRCMTTKGNAPFINELINIHKNNLKMRLPATYKDEKPVLDLTSRYFFRDANSSHVFFENTKEEQRHLPNASQMLFF